MWEKQITFFFVHNDDSYEFKTSSNYFICWTFSYYDNYNYDRKELLGKYNFIKTLFLMEGGKYDISLKA